MRLRWLAVAGALLIIGLGVARALSSPEPVLADEPDIREGASPWIKAGTEPVFAADEIVVRFESGVPPQAIEAINRSHGATTLRVGARSGLHRLKLPPGADLEAVIESYERRPEVAEAARNAIARVFGGPDDPYYYLQWHLDHQGSTPASWNGINWQDVWERPDQPKGTGMTVAVIDTGVAYANPNATDLAGQSFLVRPASDTFNNDDDPSDDHGHGTHVAGTIAQRTNNTAGVAGVASGATIMPVKVLNNAGEGTEVEVIEGIYLAIGATAPCSFTGTNETNPAPARVINMSLGWPVGTTLDQLPGLADALECAKTRDVVVVAAAGNDGSGTDISYPAKYPTVIAVGATTIDEQYTWYSNASNDIDLVAPGGDDCSGDNWILCLLLNIDPDKNGDGYTDGVLQQTFALGSNPDVPSNWAYYFLAGTSMASPHVAGTAALVRGVNPSLSAVETRAVLENSADALNLPWPSGHGLVNAGAAVQQAAGSPPPPPSSVTCTAPNIYNKYDSNSTGAGTVSFTWDGILGASQYKVQRQTSTGWSTRQTSGATSFAGRDAASDPNWRVFVSAGTCTPIPGPETQFDP